MKQPSLRVNFVMNCLLTLSSILFPLITTPYISRILLPEGTGKVAFATSVITYFSLLAQLGIPTYGIQACVKVRHDRDLLSRTFQEIALINLVTTALAYLLLFLSVRLVPRFRQEKALFMVTSLTIFLTFIGTEWLFKALEQYTYITVRSLICKLIALACLFLFVRHQEDYILYSGIAVLSAYGSGLANLLLLRRHVSLKPTGHYRLRRHIKPILVLFAMSVATTVYTNLDKVMLGVMQADQVVGYYDASVKIKNLLAAVVTSLGAVVFPRVSRYVSENRYEEFDRLSARSMHFILLVSLPVSVFFILASTPTIHILAGDAYLPAVSAMRAIMPTVVFIGLTNISGFQILLPLGKEKIVVASTVAGALVDLFLNWLLIPSLGALGASIGTLAAELVVLLVQFYFLRERMHAIFSQIQLWKPLSACLLPSLLCLPLHFSSLPAIVQLAAAACLFFGGYCALLLFWKESLFCSLFYEYLAKIKRHLPHHPTH